MEILFGKFKKVILFSPGNKPVGDFVWQVLTSVSNIYSLLLLVSYFSKFLLTSVSIIYSLLLLVR